MDAEHALISAATFVGTHVLAWFFAGLVLLLLGVALSLHLLQRYPLRHASGQHSTVVLIARFATGFLAILACAMLFAELADEIELEEDLAQIDLSLSQAVKKHTAAGVVQTFAYITHLGDPPVLIAFGVIVAIALFAFRQRWLALGWVITVSGNGLLNPALKEIFQRLRPQDESGRALVEGWSFPSGHSSGAVVFYGMLGYVLIRLTPRSWHLPLALLLAMIAFSTGASRLFLQYHYASDVLAGFASGTAWLLICISAMEYMRWHRERHSS